MFWQYIVIVLVLGTRVRGDCHDTGVCMRCANGRYSPLTCRADFDCTNGDTCTRHPVYYAKMFCCSFVKNNIPFISARTCTASQSPQFYPGADSGGNCGGAIGASRTCYNTFECAPTEVCTMNRCCPSGMFGPNAGGGTCTQYPLAPYGCRILNARKGPYNECWSYSVDCTAFNNRRFP